MHRSRIQYVPSNGQVKSRTMGPQGPYMFRGFFMVNGFLGGQNLDVSWVFGWLMVGRYNNPKEVFGGV